MSLASRRTFLKTAGAAAAVAAGAGKLSAKPFHLPLGLELYSVRAMLPTDLDGTLAKVRAAGYLEVEAAQYYSYSAARWRKAFDDAGVKCISGHWVLQDMLDKPEEHIEFAHRLGMKYLVSPAAAHRKAGVKGPLNLDDWRYSAEKMNVVGEKVKSAGLIYCYHNHNPEFGKEDGVMFYDELLRLTDPKLVSFELDCGWVASAGIDPAVYLSKSPERFPLLHVKDMVKGDNGEYHSCILGKGVVNYRPILRAATGSKHYYIEQEEFDRDIMESLRQDVEYMRKLDL